VSVWNEDQFSIHKLFDAKAGKFLAIPRALDPSEKQLRKADIRIVDGLRCLDESFSLPASSRPIAQGSP
jgi:hypothetical protein